MAKYRCIVRGWIYDLEPDDPDSGIKPVIPFEDLPADYIYPVCGAPKGQFEKAA